MMYFCKECKGLFNKENIENKKNTHSILGIRALIKKVILQLDGEEILLLVLRPPHFPR